MAGNVRVAQQKGDLPAELEPEEVAFELDAILVGADANFVLFDDPERLDRAKLAVRRVLGVADPTPAG
jgi:hypothetical protein